MKICDLRSALTTRWLALLVGWVLAVPLAQSASAPADSPAFLLDTRLTEITASATYSSGGGIYGDTATITITSNLANRAIYYSVDGVTPSIGGPLTYTAPFTISATKTIRALAVNLDNFETKAGEPLTVTIVPTYALALTTAGGGTVVATPAASRYLSGTVVSITATPATGWTWMNWTGGDVTGAAATAATASVTMSGPRTAAAVFGTTLTTSVTGGGAVAVSPAVGPYAYGSVVRLVPKPNEGSAFSLWGSASSGSANPLDFTVTVATRTISALFSTLSAGQVNVYASVVGNGTVSVSPQKNVYTTGESVTLTAVPGAQQVFTGWSGGVTSVVNPLVVTLATSQSVTANFRAGVVPVITNFSPKEGVVGSSLTITGTSFDLVPGNNAVYFGPVRATVTAATATALTVTVPAGAGYVPLTVAGLDGFSVAAATAFEAMTFGVVANKVYGAAAFGVSAAVNSGLPVGLSVVSGPASISGTTVTLTGAGDVTLRATRLATGSAVAGAPVEQTFTVAKAAQTITLATLTDKVYGAEAFLVTATASSGLVPALSMVSGPATLSGATLTVTGVGPVVVRASQAGNGNYNPAVSVERTFSVGVKEITVSGITVANKIYDGTTVAAVSVANAQLVGVVAGDTVGLAASAVSGVFETAGLGVGKPVNVTGLGLSGVDAGKYTLTAPVLTAAIEAFVSGPIFADTTWGAAAGPFVVTADVQVAPGVTLTIEPGATVQFAGAFQIYIRGTLIANGTVPAPITFGPVKPNISSGATMLKFEGTNLNNSQLSNLRMSYANRAILVGGGGGEFNPGLACTGTLTVTQSTFDHVEIRTGGYGTSAKLVLDGATITASTVVGQYPRSEFIEIRNSSVSGSTIRSDSYNAGIKLENTTATDDQFLLGCCGANFDISNSAVVDSQLINGGGSPVAGPVSISRSRFVNTRIDLPAVRATLDRSAFKFGTTPGVRFGNGAVTGSSFSGVAGGVVMEWTGFNGYDPTGNIAVASSTFSDAAVGIKLTNANSAVIQTGNNFLRLATYDVENRTSKTIAATGNFWGVTTPVDIAAKIYDFFDDISFGQVTTTGALSAPATAAPISQPTGVQYARSGNDVVLTWTANPESDVAGYKVYYGTTPRFPLTNIVDVRNVTTKTLVGLAPGLYYFTVAAYDASAIGTSADLANGNESSLSDPVTTGAPVAITTQPSSQTAIAGQAANFSVVATGNPAPTYQWKKNTLDILGATMASLTLSNVQLVDATNYQVVVTNALGSVTSSAAVLSVTVPPVFTTQPIGTTILAGTGASFSVAATGTPAPTFQWQRQPAGLVGFSDLSNGGGYSGATSTSLALSSATVAMNGDQFHCVATNSAGNTTSTAVVLRVNQGPTITTQPVAVTVAQGGGASFTAAASGNPAPMYQWQKNNVNVAGATDATITLANVQPAAAGNYRVIATNSVSSATSNAVALTVNVAPAISTHPANITVNQNLSGSFSVVATGNPAPTYQWRKNTVNIGGQTAASLTFFSTQPADAASYDVVVTNVVSSATSNAAILSVNTAPAITTPPVAQAGNAGGSAAFTVVATGTPAPSYQWFKETVLIVGATSATYPLSGLSLTDAGSYKVAVTNVAGSVTSAAAVLVVNYAPVITSQPVAATINQGQSGTLTVVATGVPAPTYTWRKGGLALTGNSSALTATLVVANAQAGDGGSYDVVVTNTQGTVTSAAVVVGVNLIPVITTPPVAQAGNAGGSAAFTVVATGTPAPSYQWFKETVPIVGATSATYPLSGLSLTDAGSYKVVVTNVAGSVTSAAAVLVVNYAPVITSQPVAATINQGQSGTLTVVATGYPALSYQWKFNGASLTGATNASLTLNSVSGADAGSYSVVISNALGVVTSNSATLVVNVPPSITTQPQPQGAVAGGSVTFTVVATGSPAPSFQWYKGTNPILNATGASLVLANVSAASVALYKVVVSNGAGSISSDDAQLSLYLAPLIATQPATAKSVSAGTAVDFIVVATGTPAPSFQWRKDGVAISGATSSIYTIAAAGAVDGGTYTVVVTNAGGFITSNPSVLTVSSFPVITQQPVARAVTQGSAATFSVAAVGSAPLTYEWRKDGVVIPGAIGSSYTLGSVQTSDASSYLVIVHNSLGSVSSNAAVLTVAVPVTITTAPANVTVAAGSPASFTVVVAGTAPFTYQWQKDGVGIAGANLATLSLPTTTLADAGSYAVKVSNAVSDVSSSGALLTVTAPPAITTQPQALTVVAGEGASLTVVATGGPAPTYQWKKNGSPVAGATLATLTFAAAQAADAAAYTVEVVNSQGAVTSTAAALTVISPPVITRQPAAQTANVGGSVVLVVAATGNATLTYQWRRGGTAISGATTATYRFLARASGDAGSYDVVIKAGGVAITTSTAVAFAVNDAPLFGPGLTGAYEIGVGEGITLAAASPLAAQSWRWYRNGQPIAGAAASTLVLTNVSRADAGWYQLQTTSATGAVSLSAAVFLQVRIPNQVIAFGANTAGQSSVPTAVSDALAVSAGYNHTLAIRSGGNVVGWGSNLYSQLSLPTKLGRSVQVAAGVAHSVALQSDGTVVAWGTGGATGSGVATVPTSLANVVAIAAGRVHTLALKSDGTVVGWGAPSFGQELPPVGLRDVVAIAAGSEHSLALRADGTVVAWGNSNDGRIALPAGLANIVAVAAGAEHSLALRADGRVIAWGKADSGRTVVPADLTHVIAIAGGIAHSVALRADGTLVAWGAADQGQAAVPLGLGSVYELSAAGGFHTAVLRDKRNDAVPVILTSPENRTVAEGASLRLAATGNFGTAPLNVQWTRNGTAIPGASLSTYIVPEVTGAVAGTYQVSVSNYLGTATSGSAVVQVTVVVGGTPASIVVPPVSVSVLSGRATTLMVEAAGTPPLSYVWKRNGLTVTGATTSRLDLTNVTADAAYTVAVSNSITTVVSAPAQISVFTAQALLSAATSGYVEGTLVTLQTSLTFGGSLAGLGLQLALPAGWTFVSADDQAPVRPGAGAGGTLGWAWTTVPASPVTFSVVLRASADSVGPRAVAGFAILRAGGGAYDVPFPALELPQVSKPRVVLQPASGLLALSGNAALTVGVSGAAPFTYVWTRNGQTLVDGGRISGAGTSMLTLTGATTVDAGSYQVTVSNSAGTVTSQAATLAVVDATASHALVGSGYIAGGAVTVTNTLTYSGTAGSLGWQLLLPPGWTYVAGSGSDGDIKPFAGTADLLEWAWVTIPASPLQFTYTLRAPLDSAGDQTLAALVVFRQFGVLQQFLAKPDPLVLTKMVSHSADTNRDGKISLLELTRVIELYNTRIGTVRTGCYKVDLAGEDGFSPDPERLKSAVVALASYHSADTTSSGQLDLNSLTRVIQLYNYRSGSVRTGQYRVQSGTEVTEDGFAPGPP